jgi:hypothetical protein
MAIMFDVNITKNDFERRYGNVFDSDHRYFSSCDC